MRANILSCVAPAFCCCVLSACDFGATVPNAGKTASPNKAEADAAASRAEPPAVAEAQPKPPANIVPQAPNDNFTLPELIERVEPSVVRIDAVTPGGGAIGSGFLVSDDGWLATNAHVIQQATAATVVFRDGTRVAVEGPLLVDPQRDIAILKVPLPTDAPPPLLLAAASPRKGESVAAFGCPQGLSFTASTGIVSGLRTGKELNALFHTKTTAAELVQTTAPVSGGNSGGPLVNHRGEVVGMNTMLVRQGQNLNFAVSSMDVAAVIRAAAGRPVQGWPAYDSSPLPPPEVPSTADSDQDARHRLASFIENELRNEQQRYVARLERRKNELETLEGTIRSKQQLLEIVKGGGDEALAVMRKFPVKGTRPEWVRQARRFIDERQQEVDALRQEIDQDLELARRGLFPIPTLSIDDLSVGKFGYLLAHGKVSQLLGEQEFLAYFDDVQVHCAGFNLAGLADDAPVAVTGICIVPERYTYTTVTGARRTLFSLRPFDPAFLPAERQAAFAQRAALEAEFKQQKLEQWRQRIERNRAAVAQGARLPALGTQFEPEPVIELITGEKEIEAPRLPKRYQTQVSVLKTPLSTPSGVIYIDSYTTKQVETAESIRWRQEQLRIFNEKKAVYPAYSLACLIRELEDWASDPQRVYNDDGSLQGDLDRLVDLAFLQYGVTGDRSQNIPWSNETRDQIAEHLREIAIQYGQYDQAYLLAFEEKQDENEDPDAKEKAAATALRFAKVLLSRRDREYEGERRLKDLIEEFPGTAAALEAGKILKRRKSD